MNVPSLNLVEWLISHPAGLICRSTVFMVLFAPTPSPSFPHSTSVIYSFWHFFLSILANFCQEMPKVQFCVDLREIARGKNLSFWSRHPPPCLTGGGLASHLSFSYPDPPSPVSSVAHFLCAGLRSAARFLDPGQVQEAVEVVHLRFFQLCVEQCGVSLVVMSATCDE